MLAHIVSNLEDNEQHQLANAIISPQPRKHCVQKMEILKNAIKKFYERDDITRVSPKTRDVKEYACPDTGEKLLLPTRHMTLTTKEAWSLFNDQQEKAAKGIKIFSM